MLLCDVAASARRARGHTPRRRQNLISKSHSIETDRDDPELMHHVGRIEEHGNRALRVIFNNSMDPVRIVTVYFDRKMKGRL